MVVTIDYRLTSGLITLNFMSVGVSQKTTIKGICKKFYKILLIENDTQKIDAFNNGYNPISTSDPKFDFEA